MEDWDDQGPEDLSYLWTATLVIPHVGMLSDEQMAVYFPDYDGRWSRQTRSAIAKLGAVGLELNTNWTLTRQVWSCPGCGRDKKDIFRKSHNGILLAKLELHHDHLWEANRRPVEVEGREWRDILPKGSPFVVETIRELVTRFNNALVCSECNAADGKAKRLLGADRRFSFAADEIRQLVKAVPHGDHEIDLETARRIWEKEKPGFERRAALLELLVDDLVAGSLQRRTEGMDPARPMFKRLRPEEILQKAFPEAVRHTDKEGRLGTMRDEFLARSVQKDVVRRKAASKVSIAGPSDEEYIAYVPKANPVKWAATGEDWTCPCCGRGKRAVLRISSKKQWSGSIRTVEQFDELFDEDGDRSSRAPAPGLRERIPSSRPARRRRLLGLRGDRSSPAAGAPRRRFGLPDHRGDEIRSEGGGRPSAARDRHELAEELSRANGRYLAAARALGAFESLRASFQTRMEHARRNPEARRAMFDDLDFLLRVQHGVDDAEERKMLMQQLRPRGTSEPP